MSITQPVLAVLVAERRRAVVRDLACARRRAFRRDAAGAFYALAAGLAACGAIVDGVPAAAPDGASRAR